MLTAALLAPVIFPIVWADASVPRQTAAAQTSRIQTVIVADFEIKEKDRSAPSDIGSWATDALAVEMASSARFEVLKRTEVMQAAKELGYRAPYDRAQLGKIAASLGATAIITGEVAAIRVDEGKNIVKTARAALKVRLLDAGTGDLLNGAAVVGSASAKPGDNDTHSLIQQAVSVAAVLSVKQILTNTLPEGIILNTVGSGNKDVQILINRGARDGVAVGMEMAVYREKQRIGVIRIIQVMPTDAEARPVDGPQGFSPQDTVRVIFPMPDLDTHAMTVSAPRPRSNSTLATVGKILLVVVVGLVIATALKGSSSVTGVTAEADIQNTAPAVRLSWRDNLFGGGTLEYHVWRTPGASYNITGIPALAAPAGQRQVYDYPAPYTLWNGVNSYLQAPLATSSGSTTGAGLSTAVTPGAGTGPAGFTAGTTYQYQVSAILRRTSTATSSSTTTTTTQEDVETGLVSSGPVTPVNQPRQTTPTSGQSSIDLSALNFTWLSVLGADVYQVEISTEQTFMDKTRIVQLPLTYSVSASTSGATLTAAAINLTNSSLNAPLRKDATFANFVNKVTGAATPTIYWRVGARNNADRPGPIHAISKSSSDQDRAFRFIYSSVSSFQPAALPPNPP